MRALGWILLLTGVYALALASLDPWDLALGAAVATLLVAALRRDALRGAASVPGLLARAARLPVLVLVVLRDITAGTWQVAAVVLGIRPLERPGIVVVPLGERSDAGALVSAFVATLSPGEFLVDVDWERREMTFHVLDAGEPDRVRERLDAFYRAHQRRVVP